MLIFSLGLTELKYCFLDTATAAYSANLKTVQLTLRANASTKCGFYDEVNISLLFEGQFATQTFIFDGFDQLKDYTITLTKISLPATPPVLFAHLNISSLTYYTVVRISQFQRIQSQLGQCFDLDASSAYLRRREYELRLKLTDGCYAEVLGARTFDIYFSAFTASVEIDVAGRKICYISEDDYYMLICKNSGDFLKYVQIPFLAISVVFHLLAQGNDYQLTLLFDRPHLGTYSTLYAAGSRLSVSGLNVYVSVSPDLEVSAQLDTAILGFDRALARFLSKHRGTGALFQITHELAQFEVSRSVFIFTCDGDYDCIEQLGEISEHDRDYDLAFDVSFFKDGQFIAMAQYALNNSPSCSGSSVMRYKGAGEFDVQLDVQGASGCDIAFSKPFTLTAVAINESDVAPLKFNVGVKLIDSATVAVDCSANANCTFYNFQDYLDLLLRLEQGGTISYILVDKIRKADYRAVTILICCIGGCVIFACLLDTAHKMVVFSRVVKSMRRR